MNKLIFQPPNMNFHAFIFHVISPETVFTLHFVKSINIINYMGLLCENRKNPFCSQNLIADNPGMARYVYYIVVFTIIYVIICCRSVAYIKNTSMLSVSPSKDTCTLAR